jgi:hypothetical protein
MSKELDKIDLNDAINKLTKWEIINPKMIETLSLTNWAIKYTFYLVKKFEEVKWDLLNSDNLIEDSRIIGDEERFLRISAANFGITAVCSNLKRVFKENYKISPRECSHPPIVQVQNKKNNTCLMCGHEYK